MKKEKYLWLPSWAWTLIFRHLRGVHNRSAVTWMNIFAVSGLLIGVFAWTSVVSIMRGLQNDRKERILEQKPHILFESAPQTGLFQKKETIQNLIGDQLKGIKFLLQSEGLLEVVSPGQKGRIIGSGVVLQGVEDPRAPVALGSELFERFRIGLNQSVRLRNVWRMDLPPLELKASDVFSTGVLEIDRSTVRLPRVQLQKWLGIKDSISRIEIQLVDPYKADEFVGSLRAATGLDFKTWRVLDSSLWYSLKLEILVLTLAVFFIVLIAAFSVHMALSVRVVDKTREIGILRALGADDRLLLKLYLTEGFLLGTIGASAGLLLGYFFCISLVPLSQMLPGIAHLDMYYNAPRAPDWNWGLNIVLTIAAIGLATLASWWPAQRVRAIDVHEALRS